MNRVQLRQRIETAWEAFRESYAGLTAEDLTRPSVIGEWTVKDVIAHVAIWEEEALAHLPTIAAGGRPPRYAATGGIDAFNAREVAGMRDLSLDEVLRHAARTHQRLLAYLDSVPEEQIARETRFRHRLRLDTYSHYPIHTRAIREWRGGAEHAPK